MKQGVSELYLSQLSKNSCSPSPPPSLTLEQLWGQATVANGLSGAWLSSTASLCSVSAGTLAERGHGLAGHAGGGRTTVLAARSLYRAVLSGHHSRGSQGGNTVTAAGPVPAPPPPCEGIFISPETRGLQT